MTWRERVRHFQEKRGHCSVISLFCPLFTMNWDLTHSSRRSPLNEYHWLHNPTIIITVLRGYCYLKPYHHSKENCRPIFQAADHTPSFCPDINMSFHTWFYTVVTVNRPWMLLSTTWPTWATYKKGIQSIPALILPKYNT